MKAFILLILPFMMLSCNGNEEAQPVKTEPLKIQLSTSETKLVVKNNDFANKMLADLCTVAGKNKNVTLSPLSMSYLLGLIANGANKEALSEILTAMNMNGYSLSDMNAYFGKISAAFPTADPQVKLSLANAAWIQNGFSVKRSYVEAVKTAFDAEVNDIDFTRVTEAQNTLNSWCSKKTNGLIKETSLQVDADMKLVLANAAYFKGKWADPFEKSATTKADFTNENGDKSQVNMMSQTEYISYDSTGKYDAVVLPYGNGTFSMVLVLPAAGSDINALSATIPWSQLGAEGAEVHLRLPRFKVENHWDCFQSTLKALGINQIFNPAGGNVLENIANDLFVSDVTQDVCLELNEEGTEAAAVSMGGIECTSVGPGVEPIEITFNRPFLYALRENSTGVTLFMGKIASL